MWFKRYEITKQSWDKGGRGRSEAKHKDSNLLTYILGNSRDSIYNFKLCLNVTLGIIDGHLPVQDDSTGMLASHPLNHQKMG